MASEEINLMAAVTLVELELAPHVSSIVCPGKEQGAMTTRVCATCGVELPAKPIYGDGNKLYMGSSCILRTIIHNNISILHIIWCIDTSTDAALSTIYNLMHRISLYRLLHRIQWPASIATFDIDRAPQSDSIRVYPIQLLNRIYAVPRINCRINIAISLPIF